MLVCRAVRTLCSIRSQHRSAITATSFKTTVTGSIRVYIPTKPRTGTKDSRAGFQNLVADCRAGKIDMVIIKIHLPLCTKHSHFATDSS